MGIKTIIISAAYNMYACKEGDLQNEYGTRGERIMEINRDKLYDDLRELFLMYVQNSERPPVSAAEYAEAEKIARDRWVNDVIFHTKVKTLTLRVMTIVDANHK